MIRRGIGVQSYVSAGGVIPLLDIYGSAAAAYSVRKLRTLYTGSAIRVRRSSDNTEQDIGFDVNGNLDESALTTFVGAGNGFVTTWYDQSGNGRNVTQATATFQPQIIQSGSLITENSRASIRFDGSNDFLLNTTKGFAVNNITHFAVSTRDTTGVFQPIFSTGILSGSIGFGFYYTNTNLLTQQTRDAVNVNSIGDYANIQGNLNIISAVNTTTTINVYFNGVNNVNANHTISGNSNGYMAFGTRFDSSNGNGFALNGKVSEYIFWQNNLSANLDAIEIDVNNYYTIY